MNNKALMPIGLIGLLAVLLLGVLIWQPEAPKTPMTPALPKGGDFVLHSSAGKVDLKDYRGKVVAIYFGYTWCPDICPTSLSLLSAALHALTPQEQARSQAFFISLDPERDDVERLKEYASYFNKQILGITGSSEQVAEVAARYGSVYRKTEIDEQGNYSVDHSSRIYLLDGAGRLRKVLPHGTSSEVVLAELRLLLQERG
ncbi:MAG: SCO family protein [Candidatus Polarisedimenticolaceae bacterium]|nr:SCO family protein [Candidatus Polarisedimenticolaceae bacterium]